jgi:hypothetical protein
MLHLPRICSINSMNWSLVVHSQSKITSVQNFSWLSLPFSLAHHTQPRLDFRLKNYLLFLTTTRTPREEADI